MMSQCQQAPPSSLSPLLFRSRIHEVVQTRISRTDIIQSTLIGQHSEYIVEVNEASGERSTVSKRYRHFLDLHSAVRLKSIGSITFISLSSWSSC